MQVWNKWPRWSEGLPVNAGDTQQNETQPLTYNWRFPHDLWLAVAVNEEGRIALAIHPRDGILEGAFPHTNTTGVSAQPETLGESVATVRNEGFSRATR
jgi:hypothetical protein